MPKFNSNHGDDNGKETVGENAKGSRGKFALRRVLGRFKFGGHDEFLHVSPGEVGDEEAGK